jgi:hypothetical protein
VAKEIDILGLAGLRDAHADPSLETPEPTEPEPTGVEVPQDPKTPEEVEAALADPKRVPAWALSEVKHERERRRGLQEQLDAAAKAHQTLQEEMAALKANPPAPEVEPVRPHRDDFTTPAEYDTAVDKWASDRADWASRKATAEREVQIQQERAEEGRKQAEQAQRAFIDRLQSNWGPQRQAAIAAHPDWEAVVEADAVEGKPTFTQPITLMLMGAENGAEVAYHIAKTEGEMARITGLPPAQAFFELGRLSATLAKPPKPEVSRAPPPIRPNSASRSGATDGPHQEESMDAVAARVRAREASGRIGMWGQSGSRSQ